MKLCSSLFLLFIYNLSAQQKPIETIYFDFDKYILNNQQTKVISDFVKSIDTTKIESVQIYGYCDDRGTDEYNYRLSRDRVNTIQEILISNGFNKSRIIILEGKGRVIIRSDTVENLHEIRSKNRRVDLIAVKKNSYGKGMRNSLQSELNVGDKILLENILFDLGSSKLTYHSKKELDKVVAICNPKKTFSLKSEVMYAALLKCTQTE